MLSLTARQLFRALWHRAALIILIIAVALGAAAAYVSTRTARYQSTAVLQLSANQSSSTTINPPAPTSTAVVSGAARVLAIPRTQAAALAKDVTVSTGSTASLVSVTASGDSPAAAQHTASAFATAYITVLRNEALGNVSSLNQQLTALAGRIAALGRQAQVAPSALLTAELNAATQSYSTVESEILTVQAGATRASVYSPAQPGTRIGSSKVKILGLAGLVGLLVGCGLALIQEHFDTRLHSAADITAEGAVLAELPVEPKLRPRRLHGTRRVIVPVRDDPGSVFADRVRELRTALHAVLGDKSSAVVLVTSPSAGDGKSCVCANLAASWALSGRRAVAVSTDWRRTSLDALFGVDEAEEGLFGVLSAAQRGDVAAYALASTGGAARSANGATALPARDAAVTEKSISRELLEAALVPTTVAGLSLLPTGRIEGVDPGDLLGSVAMEDLITQLRREFDYIVIDTAPAVERSDAVVLASLADGVVIVASANRTDRGLLHDLVGRLTVAGSRVVGIVLNRVPQSVHRLANRPADAVPARVGAAS